jgi:two-component system chemotaxis sensor kinase CheA
MNADQEMLDLFVQESSEHLQALETDLIALESNPTDSSRLNSIFRSVHSIKGASGFFGFDPIVKLAHVMESVMSLLRDGAFVADQSMVSLLISTADKLNLMLAQADRAAEIPCAGEIAGLQAILDGKSGPAEKPEAASTHATQPSASSHNSLPDASMADFVFDPVSLVEGLKHGQNFYILQANTAAEIEAQGQSLEHFLSELASLGTLISTHASLPENTGLAKCQNVDVALRLFFVTALEPFILSGALGLAEENIHQLDSAKLGEWVKSNPSRQEPPEVAVSQAPVEPEPETVSQSLVPAASTVATQAHQPPAESTSAPTPIEPKPLPSTRRKPEETIRISVGLLDSLMNLAGEMVLGRNRLLRIAGRSDHGTENSEMQSVVQEISSVTSNLQETIMRARLQPVGGLFGKFTRIVRDLSHKLEKEIQLEIFGDDVELDRTLLEGLSDPLTHLVRNSVDHGIESPATRVAKGKKSCGTIRLSAAHLAGRVQIEVLAACRT